MAHLLIAENITELVGRTPMLHLRRIVPNGAADVFAKLEYLNPGGSVKKGVSTPAPLLWKPRQGIQVSVWR
jgi:hypothetical protein